ncbi:hypothetical protein AAT19DRAFT_8755 [Rhodotorula toruloides]|uniref:Uncharacterized protein n=1 Tax=Rhodotorula toruloides TaxID=5286 RepID=A0A2T0AI35_RHOTO|nr:hypothetical protein AAT19DRAFT_8755 [Rhodotorula toruloides]
MWFSTCLTDSCAGTCLTTPFSITSDLLYARLDGARTRRERLTRDNPRHILVEHAPRLAHEGKARTAPMFEQQHWRRKLDEMSTGPECQGKVRCALAQCSRAQGSSPTLDICWPMLGNATYTSFDGVRTAGGVSRAGQASLNLDFPPLSLTHRFSSAEYTPELPRHHWLAPSPPRSTHHASVSRFHTLHRKEPFRCSSRRESETSARHSTLPPLLAFTLKVASRRLKRARLRLATRCLT